MRQPAARRTEVPLRVPGPAPDRVSRLLVRLRRGRLDREIAAGAPIEATPRRALRGRQLQSARERRVIAACLERILEAAEECGADPGLPLLLDHAAVLGSHTQLMAVIERLRGDDQLDAQGVALARRLIDDRAGPLFQPGSGCALQLAVLEIADALESFAPAAQAQPAG